ncbi:Conserved protein {ECO:0000313/EMBL:AAB84856,1} [Methanothermobacter wolfeii]|uniref:metal-dependent hydrolase n=1 Tax=Methanothermobacter wolfeii TaxID=145261 RepID=UPI00092D9693|nr:Conserved protein {ECO:0000313/EMBL:AAB84856,1} [Methanothermobacter wolfeii]
MKPRTHIVAGALLFIIINTLIPASGLITGALLAGASAVTPDIMDFLTGRHRGIGHSLLILPPLLLFAVKSPAYRIPLLAGITSHIIMDLFTVYGCPLLYPLKDTPYHCLRRKNRIRTGTAGEWALLSFLIVMVLAFSLLSAGALDGTLREVRVEKENLTDVKINLMLEARRDVNITVIRENCSERIIVDYADR